GKQKGNTVTYGVSDYAYFNIYESLVDLNNSGKLSRAIPENVLKIFVEELINNYKRFNEGSEKEKVLKGLKNIKLNTKVYKVCTMFSNDITYRFNDKENNLNEEDLDFLEHNRDIIEELKKYLEINFYEVIIGSYNKIIFSNFNSLYIENKEIKGVDFQTAIRSTCHVDSKSLESIGKNHKYIFAKPGSTFVENGVVRSDSGVPRIKELSDLGKDDETIEVLFVYDTTTSYITSAIINKAPFFPKEEIPNCDGYIILSSDEINNCEFFKVERFFRELMIFTFKNLQFSHDKNKEIVEFLKKLSGYTIHKSPNQIKETIIQKINSLINDINKEYNKKYSKMTGEIFNLYLKNVDSSIQEFFRNGESNNPDWFTSNFKRNN
ncbi:MAG: hypothetical protein QM490_00530, partial [Candidatus Gracilibacteria bacterium]